MVYCSSRKEINRAQPCQARTEKLDLESKMVSSGVGCLGRLGVSFIGRRCGLEVELAFG